MWVFRPTVRLWHKARDRGGTAKCRPDLQLLPASPELISQTEPIPHERIRICKACRMLIEREGEWAAQGLPARPALSGRTAAAIEGQPYVSGRRRWSRHRHLAGQDKVGPARLQHPVPE